MLERLIAKVEVFSVRLSCEDAVDKERVSTLLAQRPTGFEKKLALFYLAEYLQSYVQLYLEACLHTCH